MANALHQPNAMAFVDAEAQATDIDTTEPDKTPHADLLLQVSTAVQTTLDLNHLLDIFYKEINTILSVSGLVYTNHAHKLDITVGTLGKHCCNYNLLTQKDSMGDLQFTRDKHFTKQELELIELLLSVIIFPIRNTLMHRHAIETAHKDPLTGTGNRVAMDSTLERELALVKRHDLPLSIMLIDVDKFKDINDRYGHASGDRVLQSVAHGIVQSARETDAIFRYGGDEFMVLLNKTNYLGSATIAERIRRYIEQTRTYCDGETIATSVSVGIATLRPDDDMPSLFQRADHALYAAKGSGRNAVIHSNTLSEEALSSLS